jgi:peroxiredoxin
MGNTPRLRPTADTVTEPAPARRRWVSWVAALAPILALVALITANTLSTSGTSEWATKVPDFILPATDGSVVDRAETLADGDALYYFSMGVGCDGCFAQIPELEEGLSERGIRLVPVMVDPLEWVAMEQVRWGITMPIVIDADRGLSAALGMLGQYGHGDQPSHSFALVRSDATVAWVRHYIEMFVPAEALFAELDAA